MLGRLTKLATDRPRRVLVAAGVLFVVAAAIGLPVTGILGSSSKDFQNPASEEERADAAITAATGQAPYDNVDVLLRAPRDVRDDPAARRAAGSVLALLAAQHGFRARRRLLAGGDRWTGGGR